MSLYEPLTQYRGQWVAVSTASGHCHHGVLQTLTRDYLCLKEDNGTDAYILLDRVVRFAVNAPELEETKREVLERQFREESA